MSEINQEQRIWVIDTRWQKFSPRQCRFRGDHPKQQCSNTAYYGLKRSNGYWMYCEKHMYGSRIKNGVIETLVHLDSPAAKKGYI